MTKPDAKLTDEQVQHVAKLSRLDLDPDQIHRFAQQLSDVLTNVAKLNELDVTDIEPMAHAMDVTNVMRDDVPATPLSADAALTNAPQRSDDFFQVPKVLGEGFGA